MLQEINGWLEVAAKVAVVSVLIFSSISLIAVFQADYIPEVMQPRALSLSIVAGLSAVAAAILFKIR
ncbi:hypothetical protein GJU40_02670 [Bacillus lacus]|uniref:Uncharacterized protein n=1 Tax=Metabacillus lacus TaxID=1983721 RepID=A0A7X2IWF8_9BACI|nr:hypothetical protein [Metabacillus lacus]MRX71072.1 hypothetical protein [Metabacillus lacus]